MPLHWIRLRLLAAAALAMLVPRSSPADWSYNGNPVTRAARAQNALVLAPDGSAGCIAAWDDNRGGNTINLFAQHLRGDGTRAPGWAPNGDSVTALPCDRRVISILPDGAGGALLAWSENRCQIYQAIYAARITSSGALAPGWPVNGLTICDLGMGDPQTPVLTSDGAGGAIIAWSDNRNGAYDVFAQRVTPGGAIVWPANGVRVCTGALDQLAPAIAPDGAGGAYLVWRDRRSGEYDLYAGRITGSGTVAVGWSATGLPVCTVAGDQTAAVLLADGAGQAFVAWQDHRAATYDIYAQRLAPGGTVGWTTDGVPVCTAAGDQIAPAIDLDGAGGLLLAWGDTRAGVSDVYAQRLTSAGAVAGGWTATGMPACTAAGTQLTPQLAGDGAGGAYVVWQDSRDGNAHIYAQHLDGSGQPVGGWTATGQAVCTAGGAQQLPRIVADGTGGALTAWLDARTCDTTATDIYARRLASGGPIAATVASLSALHRSGQTFLTWSAPGGDGWTYRVYSSAQPIQSAADLSAATLEGTVADSTWYDRRLSVILGSTCRYQIDSLGPPLAATQGLFVSTPAAAGLRYYAVTAQQGDCGENRTIVPGANALLAGVSELPGSPAPVFQRSQAFHSVPALDVYTLWTTDRGTPMFPAMANRPSSPFDCAVVRGGAAPLNSLLLSLHVRGADFLQGAEAGSGYPGEWILSLDDPLPTLDYDTYWYGYADSYDVTLWKNPVPAGGVVRDVTLERVIHTVQWARHHLPIDTTQVCASGFSMGGIGSELLAIRHPEWIAAVMSIVGKFDFSFLDDPNPANWFNTGGGLRQSCDRLWGTVASNLPTSEGLPVYQELNDGAMIAANPSRSLPPIIAFNGKNDYVVGWAEKIPFYQAVLGARQAAAFYWDTRDHLGSATAAWAPAQDPQYIHRFRTDRSFPALAHCSADDDPGDGNAASGDSVGAINGFLQWDTLLVDQPATWQTTLTLRDLPLLTGTAVAPESLTVDVTPRRTQAFRPAPQTLCAWQVTRVSDGAVVQGGQAIVDSLGLVTVPAAKVYRAGSRVRITALGAAGIGPPGERPPVRPELRLPANPLRGTERLVVVWPLAGEARLDLYDVSGRRAQRLVAGRVKAGPQSVPLRSDALPAGVYFLEALQDGRRTLARMVVVR